MHHFKPIIPVRRFFPSSPTRRAASNDVEVHMRISYLSALHLSRTCVFLASIVLVASNASRWAPSGFEETRSVPVNPKPVLAPVLAPSACDPQECPKKKCLRGGKESPADHKTKSSVSGNHPVHLTRPSRAAALNRT